MNGPDYVKMLEQLATMVEGMSGITAACVGYRAQLEEAGYSPTMAEALAGELHRQMIIMVFNNQRPSE